MYSYSDRAKYLILFCSLIYKKINKFFFASNRIEKNLKIVEKSIFNLYSENFLKFNNFFKHSFFRNNFQDI